jgi:hypothetical protein
MELPGATFKIDPVPLSMDALMALNIAAGLPPEPSIAR